MKRLFFVSLALALLLTACAGEPGGTPSSKAASSVRSASSAEAASVDESSADASLDASSQVTSSQSPVTVIENGSAVTINALNGTNISKYIPDVCTGKTFVINGGTADSPLAIDTVPLLRLYDSGAPVSGNGTVRWSNIGTLGALANEYLNTHRFTGVIPVSKFNDPIFMSTALPSEAPTIMTWRVRASNMYPTQAGHVNALAIGAIYPNTDTTIPDDAEITICIRSINLLFHTPDKGWIQADKQSVPSRDMVRNVYYLPWGNGQYSLPNSRITFPGADSGLLSSQSAADATHVEIRMTGADFNGKGAGAGKNATSACLHFWGRTTTFSSVGVTATDVDGFVSAYEVWVKEPEMAGKLVAAIGVDLRPSMVPKAVDNDDGVDQNYSGRNHKLTNEPRWVIGHSVGTDVYDQIVDTEKVQQLIGMK